MKFCCAQFSHGHPALRYLYLFKAALNGLSKLCTLVGNVNTSVKASVGEGADVYGVVRFSSYQLLLFI